MLALIGLAILSFLSLEFLGCTGRIQRLSGQITSEDQ
jgi:hypothetical protein